MKQSHRHVNGHDNSEHFLSQGHVLQGSLSMSLPSVSPPGSPFLARADSDILPQEFVFPDRRLLQTGDETW